MARKFKTLSVGEIKILHNQTISNINKLRRNLEVLINDYIDKFEEGPAESEVLDTLNGYNGDGTTIQDTLYDLKGALLSIKSELRKKKV